MEESKVTKMKTPYQEWTEEVLNTSLRLSSIKPRTKVTKYTRATKHGKTIVCPHCNKVATVYHFSWSALGCQHCNTMIDKYDWKLL
jgi:ribosomal protein S27E